MDDAKDGRRIAFISAREEKTAIYVMDADGSNERRVSPDDATNYLLPSWSPDGLRVAYWGTQGYHLRKEDIVADVWVSTVDASEHIRVNGEISRVLSIPSPTWSPDGTRLAFVAMGDPASEAGPASTIYIVWPDGSGIDRSIPLPWEPQHLVWSPVGDDLLLVRRASDHLVPRASDVGSVYVWYSATEELVEVFHGAEEADWAPDGREIVVGDDETHDVLILDQDGEPRPVARLLGFPLKVSWSPDGKRIAVGSRGSRKQCWAFSVYFASSLYIFRPDTNECVTVVEQQGRIHHLDWSGDGRRLLFTLAAPGTRPALVPYANLWVYDVVSGRLDQLTEEEEFAGFGVWSP